MSQESLVTTFVIESTHSLEQELSFTNRVQLLCLKMYLFCCMKVSWLQMIWVFHSRTALGWKIVVSRFCDDANLWRIVQRSLLDSICKAPPSTGPPLACTSCNKKPAASTIWARGQKDDPSWLSDHPSPQHELNILKTAPRSQPTSLSNQFILFCSNQKLEFVIS